MIQCILEHLIPKDEEAEETDHHKRIRTLIEEPVKTEDDGDFTAEEIKQTIKSIEHKKHQEKKMVSQAKSYCGPLKNFLD
jgi:5'-deoxynucleotidase YfbR-like HD superfamily hydrolase